MLLDTDKTEDVFIVNLINHRYHDNVVALCKVSF